MTRWQDGQPASDFGLRISFGFRISDFGFREAQVRGFMIKEVSRVEG